MESDGTQITGLPSRAQVYAIVGIAAIAWAVLLLFQGASLQSSFVKPYAAAVAVVILCFEIFDRWLWRLGLVPRLTGHPLLRGTWKGQLLSTWVDPETGDLAGPIDVFLVVRQTYSTIDARLISNESTSVSLVSSLDARRDGVTTMQWTYRNTPGLLLQKRSRIHHGAVMLEVHGTPPKRLSGYYWTDRDTKGELNFGSRSSKVHTDFEGASSDTYAA